MTAANKHSPTTAQPGATTNAANNGAHETGNKTPKRKTQMSKALDHWNRAKDFGCECTTCEVMPRLLELEEAEKANHNPLLNGVWEELPFAYDEEKKQGARDTYWINPQGEITFVEHASHYNWRDEGLLIQQGPWMQVTKESMADLFEKERSAVQRADNETREYFAKYEQLRKSVRALVCDPNSECY